MVEQITQGEKEKTEVIEAMSTDVAPLQPPVAPIPAAIAATLAPAPAITMMVVVVLTEGTTTLPWHATCKAKQC